MAFQIHGVKEMANTFFGQELDSWLRSRVIEGLIVQKQVRVDTYPDWWLKDACQACADMPLCLQSMLLGHLPC